MEKDQYFSYFDIDILFGRPYSFNTLIIQPTYGLYIGVARQKRKMSVTTPVTIAESVNPYFQSIDLHTQIAPRPHQVISEEVKRSFTDETTTRIGAVAGILVDWNFFQNMSLVNLITANSYFAVRERLGIEAAFDILQKSHLSTGLSYEVTRRYLIIDKDPITIYGYSAQISWGF